MQNHPDLPELLLAVARFLDQEVRPSLKTSHPGLAFRALIASNLCQLSAAELGFEEAQDQVELEGLSSLFPDEGSLAGVATAKRSDRKSRLATLNGRLSREIRGDLIDDERRAIIRRHLQDTLRNRLMTINPRFDSASDVP